MAAIDRVILESPTVNFDVTYLSANFENENRIGFSINTATNWNALTSSITNILNKTQDNKSYYIRTVPEGEDSIGEEAHPNQSGNQYLCVGNGFVSNFTAEGAVGDFPRSTLTIEGLNFVFAISSGSAKAVYGASYDGVGKDNGDVILSPQVNPVDGKRAQQFFAGSNPTGIVSGVIPTGISDILGDVGDVSLSVLRPGDINFRLVAQGTDPNVDGSITELSQGSVVTDLKVQSYNLSFALTREPLQKLGSKFAFSREITFPVQVTLSLDANLGDIQSDNLADLIDTDANYDCWIILRHPSTTVAGGNKKVMMAYALKNAKLDSQSFTSSIGPNKAVTLNWVAQIGGPNQTDRGLFFSGVLS
ncbi:MAG: hypothetical protein AABY22_09980 [Nanoarchaeota archaeon]